MDGADVATINPIADLLLRLGSARDRLFVLFTDNVSVILFNDHRLPIVLHANPGHWPGIEQRALAIACDAHTQWNILQVGIMTSVRYPILASGSD